MQLLSRTFLGEKTYISYPHTNIFAHGGERLVYAQIVDGQIALWMRQLSTGKSSRLPDIGAQDDRHRFAWYDVALQANRVAIVVANQARILDLDRPRDWQLVYQAPDFAILDGLCSLSKDGNKLLLRESVGELHHAKELDLTTGKIRDLFTVDWYANHFHYCPYDENWVAYSHEGPTEQIADRCWIWHAEQAPKGRLAFDQASSDAHGPRLCVGHERWGFHAVSAYVPAYAVSPAGPRGLYEIFGEGKPAKLLWESDVLWHCNMDPTGRYAIVDTTGPFRPEMLSSEEFERYRDLHLETDRTRGKNASDVVLLDLQLHRSLPISTVERTRHPYHPHPAICPNQRFVTWNDSSRLRSWIAEVSLE